MILIRLCLMHLHYNHSFFKNLIYHKLCCMIIIIILRIMIYVKIFTHRIFNMNNHRNYYQ